MLRSVFSVIVFLLFVFPSHIFAQDVGGGGIVYSENVGVSLKAPQGWVFDTKSGLSQGVHVVMYPQGETWEESPEVMYVNIVENQDETLDAFIAGDIEVFKSNAPKLAVKKDAPITLSDGNTAEVRLFSGDEWDNFECIAYAAKGTDVIIYVLSARDEKGLKKNLGAFKKMVAESSLMGVTINK